VARKPSDIVSPNLRIREDLRARVEKAAKQNKVSINRELINRITDSFELRPRLSQEALTSHLQTVVLKIEQADIMHPNLLAGLINASEALLSQLDRAIGEWDPAGIAAAAGEVRTAISNIETNRLAELRQLV
jgi:hypothetical protein